MADQPITGLPTKTASGVASTDKMLGIDSAEGYQILVQDVAKYIIENYSGSTLAGAARTPKAAIDLLNSNVSWHGVPLSVTTKALLQDYVDNQIATNGFFHGYMSATVSTNVGLGNTGHYIFAEANSTNYRLVQAVSNDGNSKYAMIKYNGTWQDWIPSNSKLSGIKYIGSSTVSNNTATASYTIDKTVFGKDVGAYLVLATEWGTGGLSDIYLVSYSGGNVAYCSALRVTSAISGDPKVTVDRTNAKFTVTGSHVVYALTSNL